jgi:hypothetical protein
MCNRKNPGGESIVSVLKGNEAGNGNQRKEIRGRYSRTTHATITGTRGPHAVQGHTNNRGDKARVTWNIQGDTTNKARNAKRGRGGGEIGAFYHAFTTNAHTHDP